MTEPRPIGMRIPRPYATEEEFIQGDGLAIGRAGMILIGAPARPPGIVVRFELLLRTGEAVFRGEGKVVAHRMHTNGRQGLEVRFTRLDKHSKSLVERVLELRKAGALAPAPASGAESDAEPSGEGPRAEQPSQPEAVATPRPAVARPDAPTQIQAPRPLAAPSRAEAAAAEPSPAKAGAHMQPPARVPRPGRPERPAPSPSQAPGPMPAAPPTQPPAQAVEAAKTEPPESAQEPAPAEAEASAQEPAPAEAEASAQEPAPAEAEASAQEPEPAVDHAAVEAQVGAPEPPEEVLEAQAPEPDATVVDTGVAEVEAAALAAEEAEAAPLQAEPPVDEAPTPYMPPVNFDDHPVSAPAVAEASDPSAIRRLRTRSAHFEVVPDRVATLDRLRARLQA